MSTSPSLRLSLRRKRSTRSSESSGSPVIKKNSPTLTKAKKEPPSTPKTHNTCRTNSKLSRSGSRSSPQLSETPVSNKWKHTGENSLRQPSPDMPFLSSQLGGTQECEVVWDCDSPGFSRDDLKKMHRGGELEGPYKPLPIAQAPHRQLFPQSRSRVSRTPSSGNTTAQLNDLLDLLSSKEHAGKKKESAEDPDNCHKTFQHILPLKDDNSEDTSSSESSALPRPLREASSQPFEVPGVFGIKDTSQTNLSNALDDSMWGDDLNLGISDINNSALEESVSSRTSKEGAGVTKRTDGSKLPSETAELSASTDIFDDDLFSESVILTTQAVEDAMTRKDTEDTTSDANYSCNSSSKEVCQKFPNILLSDRQCLVKNSGSNNVAKISSSRSELSACNFTTNNLRANSRTFSKVNINQESIVSVDSSPKRQVRRSFRFGPSPRDTKKGGPSLATGKLNQTHLSVPKNEKLIRTKETSAELRKNYSLTAFRTEKSTTQNICASNLVSNKSSKPSALSSIPNTQVTKVPIRKSLFKSNDTRSEVRQKSSVQATRGPLLRSQSSGDARLATSSPVARRSNSSVELDTSQDLEDDEFFKSLLSVLPEEEGGFSGSHALPLSPITSENRSQELQKSKFDRKSACNVVGRSLSNGSVKAVLGNQANLHPETTKSKVDPSGKRSVPLIQGVKLGVSGSSAIKTKPLDTREVGAFDHGQQTNDTFDDGLFEDDVLSLIDEVESQLGSQNAPPEPSPSSLSSQPQQIKCTQDEIARKKAAALRRREEKRRQQCR